MRVVILRVCVSESCSRIDVSCYKSLNVSCLAHLGVLCVVHCAVSEVKKANSYCTLYTDAYGCMLPTNCIQIGRKVCQRVLEIRRLVPCDGICQEI